MRKTGVSGRGLGALIVLVVMMSLVVAIPFSAARAQDAAPVQASDLAGLSLIELTQRLTGEIIDMRSRDRSGDTPIYRIDDALFVSEEDVAALLNVLIVRTALKKQAGFGAKGALAQPTEERARDFLVHEMLLTAKAQAFGYDADALREDVLHYMREGWLSPEPPTPDASDVETLVKQGLMRVQLLRNDLTSAQDSDLPYAGSAPLIDALVEELRAEFPHDAQ